MRDATKLNVYFSGDKTLFLIPLYQRNYAWKGKHCERLFSDLIKIHSQNIYSHFFGSIVSVKANEVEDDLLIIDGQQRITTISLLVLAGIDSIKEGTMKCGMVEEYINDQRSKYLLAKYRHGDRQIKLRPIDNDIKAYDALINGDKKEIEANEKSGIITNYKLFKTLIAASNLSFEDLIDSIEKLTVIDIRLDSNDNPQLIFESLNSCGKDLEEADKVRNYLLMSLSAKEQEEYYRNYWSKIESNTDMEPTMFIRDYLTVKRKTISNINDLYFDFKHFDETNALDRKELLEDMLKYSKYYHQAVNGEGFSNEINRKFKQLASIGSFVCMPYYLSFLDYAENTGLGNKVIYEVLDTIENYWARRIMCGYPANVMAKSFALLHSDILRIIHQHERRDVELTVSYAEILKYILLRKQGISVFPNDTELEEEFGKRQVYHIPLDYRCFLFERLENMDSKETDDTIVAKIKEGKYSFEHIMPQTLTAQWKQDLGADYENVHNKYLHTFGNLTITAYNSNYGNHTFQEKKEGYVDKKNNTIYGFKDSRFRLNNYIKQADKWTEDEIEARSKLLLNDFKHLWPMIETAYKPLEKESEVVSFDDDDIELTGRQIQSYIYKGNKHEVSSWKGMLVEVCRLVYREYPTQVSYLCTKESYFFTKDSSKVSKIADGCYVWTHASIRTICSILTALFNEIGLEKSQLEFDLVPQKENAIEDGGDME